MRSRHGLMPRFLKIFFALKVEKLTSFLFYDACNLLGVVDDELLVERLKGQKYLKPFV